MRSSQREGKEVDSMNIASTVLADMWSANGHMGGGWWIVMMIWMVFFWGAVIVGIVWLARGGASSQSWRAPREPTPLETLDRRFAEGAISVDEYRERRRMLTGSPDATGTDTREPVPH
jgi:putative membrane protein